MTWETDAKGLNLGRFIGPRKQSGGDYTFEEMPDEGRQLWSRAIDEMHAAEMAEDLYGSLPNRDKHLARFQQSLREIRSRCYRMVSA